MKISARTGHRYIVYRFRPSIFGSRTELGNRSRLESVRVFFDVPTSQPYLGYCLPPRLRDRRLLRGAVLTQFVKRWRNFGDLQPWLEHSLESTRRAGSVAGRRGFGQPHWQKVKVKEADLYSAFIKVPYTQGVQVRITQCYLQITPYLLLPRKHSPDGASQTEVANI